MRYLRAYQSLFASTTWMINLLGGAVCMAIPLMGWAAFTGYCLEQIDPAGKEANRASFDLNRMGDYLKRGLGPVLIQLILLTPVFFLITLGLIVAALSLGSKPQPAFGLPTGMTDRSNEYFLSSSTGLAGGVLALTLILSVVIVPLSLYIGLRQELTLASAFEFVPDFLKRVFKELLLAQIFILITGLSLLVVGLAACLIGVLPAAAWVVFAQHQLMAQLYGLHIERGGTAVGAAS